MPKWSELKLSLKFIKIKKSHSANTWKDEHVSFIFHTEFLVQHKENPSGGKTECIQKERGKKKSSLAFQKRKQIKNNCLFNFFYTVGTKRSTGRGRDMSKYQIQRPKYWRETNVCIAIVQHRFSGVSLCTRGVATRDCQNKRQAKAWNCTDEPSEVSFSFLLQCCSDELKSC